MTLPLVVRNVWSSLKLTNMPSSLDPGIAIFSTEVPFASCPRHPPTPTHFQQIHPSILGWNLTSPSSFLMPIPYSTRQGQVESSYYTIL